MGWGSNQGVKEVLDVFRTRHPECFLPKKESELEEQSHRLARFRYNAQGCQKLTRWSWQQQNRANKKRHPHPLNVQEENANENRHTPPLILTGELRWPEMRQGHHISNPKFLISLQHPKAFMRLCWCVSGVWGWLVVRTHKVILAAMSPLQKGW